VTDSSDRDAVNPVQGTLRHAVIQVLKAITEQLIFSTNMALMN
jgi:hypothetical protein